MDLIELITKKKESIASKLEKIRYEIDFTHRNEFFFEKQIKIMQRDQLRETLDDFNEIISEVKKLQPESRLALDKEFNK